MFFSSVLIYFLFSCFFCLFFTFFFFLFLFFFFFIFFFFFFFSSRRRHTRLVSDWSSDCALPISNGLSGSPVVFLAPATAGGPSASQSSVAAAPATITAGSGSSTITVTVRDAGGNPVSGATVTLAALPTSGNTLTQPAGSTDVNGQATGTLSSTAAGTETITAKVNGTVTVTQTATVNVTPAAATTIAVHDGNGQTVPAGTAVPIPPSVLVTDEFGNAVAGVAVTFGVASGNGTITGGSQTTNASGVATVGSWTLSPTAGQNTLTASSGTLSGSPVTFTATGTAGAAATIAANSATSQSATAGTAVSTPPSVIVKDANGNPGAQAAVTFAVAPGNGTITGASQTTNASGVATVGSWTLSATPGPHPPTPTRRSSGRSPVTFTATGTAGTAATIAANSPTSQTATVGTAVGSPPSVIVKDANGNPVAQVAVTFAVAPGNGTITGGSQTTNGSGIATVGSWTLSATAGSNTLTATSGSLSGSPVTFTATGTAGPSATMAKSSGDNLTGQVATRLQTPHVVLVSDANGNPVTGVMVTWAAASGGGSVDPATSTTDANGHAQTFRTLGILIGTQTTTATATIAGKDTTVTFSISATAAGASQMTAAGGDGQTGTVGTTLPTQLSVRVADQFNNPVAGVTVTWTPATGSGSVTPTTSTSNTSGIAATTWTLGATAGTQSVQATGAGSPVPFSATGTAGTAATITANSPTSQSAAAGTTVTSPPSVIVKDANGNPVADVAVTFTPAAGSGSVTGGTQTTNGSGIATVGSWTLSATAGPNTLTATSTGLSGSPVTFSATGTAGTAATIAANSATSQSATAGTAVTSPPSVIVKDV